MTMRTDAAIIGGGPGGCAQAMFLARHGVRTAIIEMESFPRYHIGESMTGEAGEVVRSLGLESYMHATGWPQKQGVKVYGEGGRNTWFIPVMRRNAHGDLEDILTWQVRRSEFDARMLREATARGAVFVPGRAAGVVRGDDGLIRSVKVEMADGGVDHVECDLLLDASGQKTFLAHAGVASPKVAGRYDRQIAIFSQFAHTLRDTGTDRLHHPDNTIICYAEQFHWGWFIPLDRETVSVGIVVPASRFTSRQEGKQDFLFRELRAMHSELSRRVPDLTPLEPVRAIPNYSYEVSRYSGRNWLCLGDAHRFIDPIFSFGMTVTMREAQFATPHIVRYLNGETRDLEDPFADHRQVCDLGLDRLQDLIDGFWSEPLSFAFLVSGTRTRPGMIDLFAGRIHGSEATLALEELNLLARKIRSAEAGAPRV